MGFKRGSPFTMIVLVARDMDADVALTGARCSDGQPLRFWLNKGGGGIFPGGPASTPVPDDVMASTGDLRAILPRIDAAATSGSTGYNGYILFPTAGAYRIQGFVGDRKIGEATIVVSEERYPAGQWRPSDLALGIKGVSARRRPAAPYGARTSLTFISRSAHRRRISAFAPRFTRMAALRQSESLSSWPASRRTAADRADT